MNKFIQRHIYDHIEPKDDPLLWIRDDVLAVDPVDNVPVPVHIYGCFQQLRRFEPYGFDHFYYLNKWNSARSDLIAEFVPTPAHVGRAYPLSIQPPSDISYWICTTLLRFTDRELCMLASLRPTELDHPRRSLLPVIKHSIAALQQITLPHPTIHAWHRARYVLIRYYTDLEYHAL